MKLHDFRESFLHEAVRLSSHGMQAGCGGPFGAVVVRDGQIVGCGFNRVLKDKDPTAHAEVVAIREACRKLGTHVLSDCEIYASCEPCPMCLASIYWARIPVVYYANTKENAAAIGFDDQFFYEELSKAPDCRKLVMKNYPDARAKNVFEEWTRFEGKVPY